MKPTVQFKNNCIAVVTKNDTVVLYDSDLVGMLQESESRADFCNKVYDYFSNEFEEPLNYKEVADAAKRFYKNFSS